MQQAILTNVPLTCARPSVFLSVWQAGESQAALLAKWQRQSLQFSYVNDLTSAKRHIQLQIHSPCRVLHNGIGRLNVMTAISEAHTQHARRPTGAGTHTHTHCQITLSLLPFLSLLFPSPLPSVSSSRSQIPGLFSPFLSLPLF